MSELNLDPSELGLTDAETSTPVFHIKPESGTASSVEGFGDNSSKEIEEPQIEVVVNQEVKEDDYETFQVAVSNPTQQIYEGQQGTTTDFYTEAAPITEVLNIETEPPSSVVEGTTIEDTQLTDQLSEEEQNTVQQVENDIEDNLPVLKAAEEADQELESIYTEIDSIEANLFDENLTQLPLEQARGVSNKISTLAERINEERTKINGFKNSADRLNDLVRHPQNLLEGANDWSSIDNSRTFYDKILELEDINVKLQEGANALEASQNLEHFSKDYRDETTRPLERISAAKAQNLKTGIDNDEELVKTGGRIAKYVGTAAAELKNSGKKSETIVNEFKNAVGPDIRNGVRASKGAETLSRLEAIEDYFANAWRPQGRVARTPGAATQIRRKILDEINIVKEGLQKVKVKEHTEITRELVGIVKSGNELKQGAQRKAEDIEQTGIRIGELVNSAE